MRLTESKYRHWMLRTWSCCGLRWELLMSKRFPNREDFAPTCPRCRNSAGLDESLERSDR